MLSSYNQNLVGENLFETDPNARIVNALILSMLSPISNGTRTSATKASLRLTTLKALSDIDPLINSTPHRTATQILNV